MLTSHYQMLTGERNHLFEKNLAAVFDAYRQRVEEAERVEDERP